MKITEMVQNLGLCTLQVDHFALLVTDRNNLSIYERCRGVDCRLVHRDRERFYHRFQAFRIVVNDRHDGCLRKWRSELVKKTRTAAPAKFVNFFCSFLDVHFPAYVSWFDPTGLTFGKKINRGWNGILFELCQGLHGLLVG